jgi:cardiolipin synthase A/B
MIENAKDTIQLQVYIYDDDETGKRITGALVAAAKRKVRVYLMVDGYASQKLSHTFIKEITDAGVNFRFFEPLFKNRHAYFGRRLHHKVIVVDNRYAMVGGVNISNHYNDMDGQPGWLDFAIHMEGEIAKPLCGICKKVWEGYLPSEKITPCHENPLLLQIGKEEDALLRIRRNDWVLKKNQISYSYIEMLRKAEQEIIMMSGYFLPGPVIRRNLRQAARRGVKIKLILAGTSDVKVAKNAERYMYGWLFRNGIEVYEYKPCILHGKVAVSDQKWATIGSYNVNIISAYASIELNIDVNNADFALHLHDTMKVIIEKDCTLITKEVFNARNNIFDRAWERVCYWIIRFLFFLFTINFKQKE